MMRETLFSASGSVAANIALAGVMAVTLLPPIPNWISRGGDFHTTKVVTFALEPSDQASIPGSSAQVELETDHDLCPTNFGLDRGPTVLEGPTSSGLSLTFILVSRTVCLRVSPTGAITDWTARGDPLREGDRDTIDDSLAMLRIAPAVRHGVPIGSWSRLSAGEITTVHGR